MPYVSTNGIRLAYERVGRGERVLMIMGQAAGGNVWSMYQVPALKAVGYEVITFDNKGVPVRRALSVGERALTSSGIQLPAVYEASVAALQLFSPATLDDDAAISGWLDIYEMSAARRSAASGQDVGFSGDLICPPRLCAEAAEVIPDWEYVEIGSCGHLGYLERPDEANTAIIEFLDKF